VLNSVHQSYNENHAKRESICASNCLNRVVGPTWCFPHYQFASFPSQTTNSIFYPIPFFSNASDTQCTILKINCFNGFSSSRALQRYIVCKIPSPFEFFSIFLIYFLLKTRVSNGVAVAGKKERGLCPVGSGCSERNEERKVVRLDGLVARVLGPIVIINETQGWCAGFTQIFVPSKSSTAPNTWMCCLSPPIRTQVVPLKILDQILALWLIWFSPIDFNRSLLIQKSWKFHQKSLNSWWSPLYF
jgi:hypothetical protein